MIWWVMDADRASACAEYLWAALWGVWVVMWFGTKRAKKRETPWERVQHLIPLVFGFWLLFERNWNGLDGRLVPKPPLGESWKERARQRTTGLFDKRQHF